MKEAKWEKVITTKERYPDIDTAALARVVDCDVRTVLAALERKEAEHLKVVPIKVAMTEMTDVELVVTQLRKLCSRDNPDVRALNCLVSVLDKTGQLTSGGEQKWKGKLDKMSASALVNVAKQEDISLPQQDEKDALYL